MLSSRRSQLQYFRILQKSAICSDINGCQKEVQTSDIIVSFVTNWLANNAELNILLVNPELKKVEISWSLRKLRA